MPSSPKARTSGSSDARGSVEVGANEAERIRNRVLGAGSVDDPYPRYDALRESGPVHEGTIAAAFALEGAPATPTTDGPKQFSCYDWATVEQVLCDGETFSSTWYKPLLEPTVGTSLIQLDGAEHRRHRELIQPALRRSRVDGWRDRWIQPTVDRILDDCIARGGPVNLYTELCAQLPIYTIASAFGIAGDDVAHFHDLAIRTVGGAVDPADSMRASHEIAKYLGDVVADRRAHPKDDLISLLCTAEMRDAEGGGRHVLDDEEILAFARVMLPAGAGTTYRGLGCLLLGLLQTDQLELLRSERHRLDDAIEEALRWEQPLTSLGRVATRDTELAGVPIPKGSQVYACVAAANHDPSRWPDPHRFDITREHRVHASFGLGPHLCIGMHLARVELRTAMNAILDRLPGLRLDPDAPEPWITGLVFRMPTAVPVVFEA
jgi:cytochrome P450